MYKNSIFLRLRNKNQVYIIDYFNNGFRIHLSESKQPFLENLKIEDVIEFLEKHLIMKSETFIDQFNIKYNRNVMYSLENITPLLFQLLILG